MGEKAMHVAYRRAEDMADLPWKLRMSARGSLRVHMKKISKLLTEKKIMSEKLYLIK